MKRLADTRDERLARESQEVKSILQTVLADVDFTKVDFQRMGKFVHKKGDQ